MFTPTVLADLKDLARLSTDVYVHSAEWTQYYEEKGDHAVCYGLKETDTTIDVVFRGSKSLRDWFNNFRALPTDHPQLGPVESGFVDGLQDVLTEIGDKLSHTEKRIRIGGHSLGGARAFLFSGLLTVNLVWPSIVAGFGSPKPGMRQFSNILSELPDVYCFRNGPDPVPELPLSLPEFPYELPRSPIGLRAAPTGWPDLIEWHAATLYQKAVTSITVEPTPARTAA